ncbi:MAG: hypothetical protein CBD18_04680 [Opitutales bacterium TMED158]|nr:MAG: hypothetical protein CBD18_04680 [Opitutales bacterium TMED158]
MTETPPTKILIVDDEESLLNLLKVILEANGYRTLSASNAKDALSILNATTDRIHAVLLDLNLEGSRGESLYESFVAIDSDLAIFPMSGCLREEIEERFIGKDIAGAIAKPFLPATLLKTLEQGLAHIAQ